MNRSKIINLDLIRKLRLAEGISIEEMSKLLGYGGYQAYYYKERGIRNISVEDIAKIASILKVPIAKLFFEIKITGKVMKQLA